MIINSQRENESFKGHRINLTGRAAWGCLVVVMILEKEFDRI